MSGHTMIQNWIKHGRRVISFWRERGFVGGVSNLYQVKEVQVGDLKGVDAYGNAYYESYERLTGRNRWVVYPDKKSVDASRVPAEWHGWLHYMHDETPVEHPPVPRSFQIAHQTARLSGMGSNAAYLPPGHFLSQSHTVFGATGEQAADTLNGTYQAWNGANTSPEQERKFAVKTARR